ncbi:MAG: hypothetical protein GKR97_18790 [Rhizobiaceae bacterium]|nr:hypothetical protein [Rhizobiaceae bacterium]
MVSDLGELIARYEAAKARVINLIDAGVESESDLIEADQALSDAFNNLLHSGLSASDQYLERMHYLLELIKESQSGNQLIDRLADTIWQDMLKLEIQEADEPVEETLNGTNGA